MTVRTLPFLALLCLVACSRPATKQYELKGQILGIKPEANEVLVKHEDIKGFMPAMTMPYKVSDAALLKDKQPGDLFVATLVVGETEGVLSRLEKTGHAAIDQPPPAQTLSPIEVLTVGQRVPDETLVDQDGQPRSLASFRGHPVAVTFMYTRCPMPDFCPLMDRHFAAIQKSIQDDPALARVRLLSITIDPSYDDAAVLKRHAARLKADPKIWSFLTGDQEHISRFAAQFGLAVVRNDAESADISHTLRTVVLDGSGTLVASHSGNSWTPSDLLADIRTVAAAPTP